MQEQKSNIVIARELRKRLEECRSQSSITARKLKSSESAGHQPDSSEIAHYPGFVARSQYEAKQRLADAQKFDAKVETVLEGINYACATLQKSLSDAKSSGRSAASALIVVEMQIEIRGQQPCVHLEKDALDIALEKHKSLLVSTDKSLGSHADQGYNILTELQHFQGHLQDEKSALHADKNKASQVLGRIGSLTYQASRYCHETVEMLKKVDDKLAKALTNTNTCVREAIHQGCRDRELLEQEIAETSAALAAAGSDVEALRSRLQKIRVNAEVLGTDGLQTVKPRRQSAVLEKVRSRLNRALVAAIGGNADASDQVRIFSRFDRGRQGSLTEDEMRAACRRALRIPMSSISDAEIHYLCKAICDADTGAVGLPTLLGFLIDTSAEVTIEKQVQEMEHSMEELTNALCNLDEDAINKAAAIRLDESLLKVDPIKMLGLDSVDDSRGGARRSRSTAALRQSTFSSLPECDSSPQNRRASPNSPRVQQARAKIYDAGCLASQCFSSVFSRLDKSNSGELTYDDVRRSLRRVLMMPPSCISDHEIRALCRALDTSNTGIVRSTELVSFIEQTVQLDDLGV